MEGSDSLTKEELLVREEEQVEEDEKESEDDDDDEFLREGRPVRLGPAAGHQRKQSPPGYRVTEKEEKHAQKVGKKPQVA